jgi:PAS domain S-box-containing protein
LPSVKAIAVLSVLVLAVTIALSVWSYVNGTRALRVQGRVPVTPDTDTFVQNASALLKQMDRWAFKVTLGTAMGGAGLILVSVFAFAWWRKALTNERFSEQRNCEGDSKKLQELAGQLRQQAAEYSRLEAELQKATVDIDNRVAERTAALSKSYASLEAELNERKHAERMLAQQAQELGRSKDVLELHVQARTQELQKLQRRYEYILNSAGEGIYGLDLQGKTTFVNPAAAKLTGWKVEDLVGKSEQEIFNCVQPNNTALMTQNGEPLTDQIFFRKDGSSFPVEYVRTPILEREKMVGAVVIFKDITERKRTEEALARKAAELARSNAELEQFAYVASHDLQEPLRKIQAFGDRLKGKVEAANLQEGRDYLERMQKAAARMQTLINDLLTFSRVISTTQPFVPVDLGAVTKEVLTDLEVRIEQTKAKVEVGTLPSIEADPMQMRQLLQNLIGNALKFQAPNAHPFVKIDAQIVKSPFAGGADDSPDAEVCELSVQDNGIGFDEKYSQKIFAMFQRLHGRNEYEGTGVGLAVCRRITDRHGGSIQAKSKPGEGATFIVTLPVHQTKEAKAT